MSLFFFCYPTLKLREVGPMLLLLLLPLVLLMVVVLWWLYSLATSKQAFDPLQTMYVLVECVCVCVQMTRKEKSHKKYA